jgi:hypothetical protein
VLTHDKLDLKMIPQILYEKLLLENCLRAETADAEAALAGLSVASESDFAEFFKLFNGPVGSENIGYQVLDIVGGDPSVITATEHLREQFGMPQRYLVISDLLAGGVLVYNCEDNAVYDVDFEGGFDRLVENQLPPRWENFAGFLADFFYSK